MKIQIARPIPESFPQQNTVSTGGEQAIQPRVSIDGSINARSAAKLI